MKERTFIVPNAPRQVADAARREELRLNAALGEEAVLTGGAGEAGARRCWWGTIPRRGV